MDKSHIQKIQAIENTIFTQIPGPNPILLPGTPGEWDDGILEMADILKDNDKYYLYYHAAGIGKDYRIGVAVADHPLGPFVKYGDKPIIDLQNDGVDDYVFAACGSVIKETYNRYFMFYTYKSESTPSCIGLATASNPLGPWEICKKNPLITKFGYVGGITKKDGKYYMFNEYPISYKAKDYGPISLATAECPEGPWTIYTDKAVLPLENWGTWDDAGYSEANVKYDGSMFHMFYGGAKCSSIRMNSKESIGYAYSTDGTNFIKYGKNPVAHREMVPYGSAFAEVCFFMEPPFVYLYHTLRYTEAWREEEKGKYPKFEHIGVQVLCSSKSFVLDYPVYHIAELEPNQKSCDSSKLPLNIDNIDRFAITATCKYATNAKKALRLHIFSSNDGKSFDTAPFCSFDISLSPGETVRQTFESQATAKFIKIYCENSDSFNRISDISISITLKKQ